MLASREHVTLRSLASAVGVSTMAVYTHFEGVNGLWGAVRQEGFTRLARRLRSVDDSTDPVRFLAALGVAYVENGLANPDLYRVMFEPAFELPDPGGADMAFEPLVAAVGAAQTAGRFDERIDAHEIATRFWAVGHGVTSLAVAKILATQDVRRHALAAAVATFMGAGDERESADRSVAAAWHGHSLEGLQ